MVRELAGFLVDIGLDELYARRVTIQLLDESYHVCCGGSQVLIDDLPVICTVIARPMAFCGVELFPEEAKHLRTPAIDVVLAVLKDTLNFRDGRILVFFRPRLLAGSLQRKYSVPESIV